MAAFHGGPDPARFTPNERLYGSYEAWCRENGVEPKKQRGLSEALKAKGYRTSVVKRIAVGAMTGVARGVEGLTVG